MTVLSVSDVCLNLHCAISSCHVFHSNALFFTSLHLSVGRCIRRVGKHMIQIQLVVRELSCSQPNGWYKPVNPWPEYQISITQVCDRRLLMNTRSPINYKGYTKGPYWTLTINVSQGSGWIRLHLSIQLLKWPQSVQTTSLRPIVKVSCAVVCLWTTRCHCVLYWKIGSQHWKKIWSHLQGKRLFTSITSGLTSLSFLYLACFSFTFVFSALLHIPCTHTNTTHRQPHTHYITYASRMTPLTKMPIVWVYYRGSGEKLTLLDPPNQAHRTSSIERTIHLHHYHWFGNFFVLFTELPSSFPCSKVWEQTSTATFLLLIQHSRLVFRH